VHGVIQFLHVQVEKAAELHRQLVSMYGENVNESMVRRWVYEFKI